MNIPNYVNTALSRLEEAGFEAFLVGGCVRDSLMGRVPGDWDITTSALPEETEAVFSGFRCIETGMKHGTVTVLVEGQPLEITTFRVDGDSSDARHPSSVRFTRTLEEDLSRRDFTVNAMAWSAGTGLVDFFGGQEDLAQRTVRCVGAPEKRFSEDALRILRALRFASTLDFSLDAATAKAAEERAGLLTCVSAERVSAELTKLLCGLAPRRVILAHTEVLGVVLPELLPTRGFDQHRPQHIYTVLEHCCAALEAVPPEPSLRLAALLHDVGKPECFSLGEDGLGHFYGHAARGAEITAAILERLRFDRATAERVTRLVGEHDRKIEPEPKAVKRALGRLGPELFFALLQLQRADNAAHAPALAEERAPKYDALEAVAREVLAQKACLTRADLAVTGRDLLEAGCARGKAVGAALEALLDDVIDGKVENEKEALLRRWKGNAK